MQAVIRLQPLQAGVEADLIGPAVDDQPLGVNPVSYTHLDVYKRQVLAVLVAVGDSVTEGQPLVKLEAMKMEYTIRAAAAGIVEAIHHTAGDSVSADALLVHVGPLAV